MGKERKLLGQILIAKGLITESALQDVLLEQKRSKEFLGKILVRRNFIKEEDLLSAISEQMGYPFLRLNAATVDLSVALKFSTTVVVDQRCFPIKADEYTVTVAMSNPLDMNALSNIEREANLRSINIILLTEKTIDELIKRYQQHRSASNLQRLFGPDADSGQK